MQAWALRAWRRSAAARRQELALLARVAVAGRCFRAWRQWTLW